MGYPVKGRTLKRGTDIVCHGHKNFPEALGYVMLSRAQDINNVFLDSSFNIDKIKKINYNKHM